MAIPGGPAAWCVAHLVIGVAGTWLARRYALRRNLVDQPGQRRSHAVATPRGGGIAIVCSALLALGWMAWAQAMPARVFACIGAGLVLVAGIGWIDDHRPLSPWSRLAVQALAAALVASALFADGRGPGTGALGFVVAMVLVNVWNFMDGIDGLAATQAILVGAGWAWLAWPAPPAWLMLALAAACLGFLPFNLPRARIFLGDVGSGSLGYLLAIGLMWMPADALRWPWLAWLPLCAFLVDAALTLALRMLRGERWWTPHLQHAYQRWTIRSGRHATAAFAYALWTACAVATMVLARGAGKGDGAVALGAGFAATVMAWTWIRWTTQEGSGQ
jgi:UDP-N-acetylmuramyl pentapeptide phosphotransferase/UDP-N-acetylglucosamine-1-phosphate transferase